MNISIYCTCSYQAVNTPDHLAACGIVLVATDADHVKKREFAYGLNKSTTALAELQCIRLALLSISGRYKDSDIVLYTDNIYAHKIMTGEKKTEVHSTVYDAIVNILKILPRFKIEYLESHQLINRASDLAKSVLNTQKTYDSKTIDC